MEIKKILISLDEGPTAEKVATAGFQLGKQLQAEIAILSVVDTAYLMTDGVVTPQEMAAIVKNDVHKTQKLIIDNVFKDYKVWSFVEEGKVYETILKVAQEWGADLLVMGTHGRTGLTHLLMGSVAEKVIHHSTIPLFVVPTKAT